MYDDRKDGFSLKDVILQILFVVLFVFILIWLFPTKGYLDKKLEKISKNSGNNSSIKEELAPIYSQIYNNNMTSMKNVAKSYFTDERLPKNVGDKVTKTLKEMIDLNLILPFKDTNNNSCDLENSYVEITKQDKEYLMKVNLKCTDNDAYVLEHMGCYTYCKTAICEKENNSSGTPTSNVTYKYEYEKVISCSWTDWGKWSDWSTKVVTNSDSRQVEPKTENIITGYVQKWSVVRTEVKEEIKTETVPYETGTISKTEEKAATKKVVSDGYTLGSKIRKTFDSIMKDTSTTKYTFVSSYVVPTCSTTTCSKVTKYIYDYQIKTPKTKTVYSCSSDWILSGTKCVRTVTSDTKKCPLGFNEVNNTCTKTGLVKVETPIYGWINGDPVYTPVNYYRYRERTCIGGAKDYKYSTSANDKDLINKGYKLSGKKEEVKK